MLGATALIASVSTAPSAHAGATAMNTEEREVLRLVNVERAKVGCPAVREHTTLATVARAHSVDMARYDYFSHTGRDGRSPFDRMRDAGYTGSVMAENIAAGQQTPAAVMKSWMNSSGHRANILNCRYRDLGVGVARGGSYGIYWTQNFGG
ncbi:uncharacterized protein YkwD [Naumannella cuiyingiana]|uniref:Uncharacterized protein YkwD n=1 Tax=Naumannella cuiyingiana TaxID=1347891 RepID=A0A7Z0ILK3_9ACTN|nr:uncharacterized protein YkwD [Naumannella cuiyingiana]